ncbi:MAG: hypothetical protein MPF33_01020 [Candidatus Aramenus sp.]|jgi:DNA-directed RNA polymerase subunit M|nr:hypothetical protein [Candidatus Aramenus sp.]
MKRETRVGILSSNGKFSCICVFRGQFLEHFVLGKDVEEALSRLGKLKEEINASNFGVGVEYKGELEEACRMILDKLTEKINKALT